jgi:hypothetical protein
MSLKQELSGCLGVLSFFAVVALLVIAAFVWLQIALSRG